MTEQAKAVAQRLREIASKGVSVWGDLQIEGADTIDALVQEVERLKEGFHTRATVQMQKKRDQLRAEVEVAHRAMAVYDDAMDRLRAENERLKLDAERLDFLEHKLFGKKWNGVIDSGSKTYWQIWSGYQHITHAMVGHTFRQAIDAARAALEGTK